MKREARQHGMVRSNQILPAPWNPRPNSRYVSRFDLAPAGGMFMKVPSRPTNHSKFTGKCTRPRCTNCHLHQTCKSRDKTKGTNKNKSLDVLSNHRLISWRVVDGRPGFNFSGISATALVDHLAHDHEDHNDDDNERESGSNYECDLDIYDDTNHFISPTADRSNYENHEGNFSNGEEEDDDDISFCEVGFEWNQVDDGWCLVNEIDDP